MYVSQNSMSVQSKKTKLQPTGVNRTSRSLTGFPPAKKKHVTIPSWYQLNYKHRYLEVWLVLSFSIHFCSLVTCYQCWFYRLRPALCVIISNPIIMFIFGDMFWPTCEVQWERDAPPKLTCVGPSSCQRSGSPTGKCCWSWKGSLEATSAEQIPAERRKPQETRSPLTPLPMPRGEDT